MSAGDGLTRRPGADDLLAGLDPELADVARRLVDDAQGHVPSAAFAQRLAGELRSSVSTGSAVGRSSNTRPPAPDDLGRSVAQPPLWARVAVGILSVTLVYGLIASVFRPKTTPEAAPTPTVAAPASATRPGLTATATRSSTVTPTPSATPTAASNPVQAGRAAGYLAATPIATPTPTLATTAVPTPTTRRRTATATRTSPPPPTDTMRPSSTPPPTEPPAPTEPTEPPKPPPTPVTPDATPTEREPERPPTPTHVPETPTPNDCHEQCTKKSQEFYSQCIAGGGTPVYCRERQAERREQCIRDECDATPVAGR